MVLSDLWGHQENELLSGKHHDRDKGVYLEVIAFPTCIMISSSSSSSSSFFLSLLPSTQGLCGNFNNIQTDDFRTATGAVEDSAAAFGNSWKTRASCFDVEDSFEDPCSNSVDKGSRLFIPELSVLNNFHVINNWKSFRSLININCLCLWGYF